MPPPTDVSSISRSLLNGRRRSDHSWYPVGLTIDRLSEVLEGFPPPHPLNLQSTATLPHRVQSSSPYEDLRSQT